VRTPDFSRCLLGLPPDTLAEVDQPATTFSTLFGCFCYVKMSFRIKNVGATYQWCMQFYFKGKIRHNLEVYVDDIVMKTRQSSCPIADLE
jgi:hypothetical protein